MSGPGIASTSMEPEHRIMLALEARGLLSLAESAAVEHHVTLFDLVGRRRFKHVVRARHALCRALRDLGLSLPEIGRLLGLDNSTVHYAVTKAAA